MKHKLSVLSVILALQALVFVFTACGADENVASEGTTKPRTITIYSITGDGTTEKAIADVQEAMNKITRSMYNIEVVLRLYPESEYEAFLNAAIEANESGNIDVSAGTSSNVTADTVVNDYGRPITVYPEAYENQLDIFLIPDGYKNFELYGSKYFKEGEGEATVYSGVATDLSTLIDQNSKNYVINQYIPQTVLNFCCKYSDLAIGGENPLLGIPSNRYYGDAEYFLINKQLFAEYRYDPSTITDMYSVQSFLCDLAKDCGEGKRGNTVPLYNTPSMNLVSLTGKNSVITQVVANNAVVGANSFMPLNIFSITAARNAMSFVNAIYMEGGIMPLVTDEVDFTKSFGAAYIYGSAEVLDKYADDYYIIQTSVPKIEAEDIYSGIYAISKYAEEYAESCMNVLNLLTTSKEYRNLFAYGVENVNYMIDEETGLVTRNNVKAENVYEMDLYKTGNSFLVMQNDEMSEAELILSDNNWAYAKATNNDAIVSPYARFTLSLTADMRNSSDPSYKLVVECIDELDKLYDEIWVWISEYSTYVNSATGEPLNAFSRYLDVLEARLEKDIYVVSSTMSTGEYMSIKQQYTDFHFTTYGEGRS